MRQVQWLRLEHTLQEWEIDDTRLAGQRPKHGVIEHLVSEDTDLATEHRLTLAAACQRVEHVEQDEARKSHGGVVGCHYSGSLSRLHIIIIAHFVDVYSECAEHDHQS